MNGESRLPESQKHLLRRHGQCQIHHRARICISNLDPCIFLQDPCNGIRGFGQGVLLCSHWGLVAVLLPSLSPKDGKTYAQDKSSVLR